ncbi:MAG: hypothetical protein LBP56_07675 [Odoribacteraceae bacterium]|jgi:hypothetical protein|nr:hypothetical protein [Odoribacteraceae bacterium]
MFRLTARIEIKGTRTWVFDRVASVEITRDIDTLTDTCVLALPKKVTWQGEALNPLRRGDEVTAWLGYDDELELAFRGHVTTIGLKAPVTIACEDYMYQLKSRPARKLAYANATLGRLLEDQRLGIRHRVFGEQAIGPYRVTADTASGLLGDLKDHGGIRSFILLEEGEPVLYCGALFERAVTRKQVFATGVNIIDDTRLEVQDAADVKIKVRAISLMPDNTRVKVEAGDADGQARTLHAFNKNERELRAWAEQELKRLKRDGLTGSFTTFGGSLVDKLDNVGIKIDGRRRGVYQVQKNVIRFSPEGFRQEITIGGRVAE